MAAIIGLVGHLASGKGTAAKYLVERHGATGLRFSDPLRETLAIYDQPNTRDNMQELSTLLRQRFGENVLAKAIARKARMVESGLVVIDGVRRLTDIEGLGGLTTFYLVAVAADQRVRYQRYVDRSENEGDADTTFEQFCQQDAAEAEVQIPQVMSEAAVTIQNDGTLEELYAKLDAVVRSFAPTR